MNNTFRCRLISPEKIIFDGELWQISARDELGYFSIRAHHQNFLAKLAEGKIEIALTPDKRKTYKVKSGILSMKNNSCTVIADNFGE